MLELSALLDAGCICMSLTARRKKDALRELCELLRAADKIEQVDPVVAALLDREKLSSTGIGNGIAIPHRLLAGMRQTVMAVGRSKQGIAFDAIDNRPVTLVFLLLGPEGHSAEHLKLLSRLARLLHEEHFVNRMREATDGQELLRIIREQERDG